MRYVNVGVAGRLAWNEWVALTISIVAVAGVAVPPLASMIPTPPPLVRVGSCSVKGVTPTGTTAFATVIGRQGRRSPAPTAALAPSKFRLVIPMPSPVKHSAGNGSVRS